MRTQRGACILWALLCTAGPYSLYGAARPDGLDPGGVAFPWPKLGSWLPERKATSGALLPQGDIEAELAALHKAGWFPSKWMGSKASADYPLPGTPLAAVAAGFGRGGGQAFHLRMSADAAPVCSTVWAINVKATEPGPYRVSGWARCGPGSPDRGQLEITFQSRKPSGELCGEHWQRQRSKRMTVVLSPGGWQPFHVEASAMPGIGKISLIFGQRGPGEIYIDDLALVKMETDDDIHVIARATGVLDGKVCIGSGELFCGGMWASNEAGRQVQQARLEFDLPAGVELVAANQRMAKGLRSERRGERVRASVPWTSRYNLRTRSFFSGLSQLYCLYTELPPRREAHEARARLVAKGYEGPWWEFKLQVLPRIEPIASPKRLVFAGNVPGELEGRAAREFVAAYSRWGLNGAFCWQETPDLAAALDQSGLYMVSTDWFWRDNFRIMHKKWTRDLMPKGAWWVGADGDGWGMCPEFIAQGHMTDSVLKPYYRKVFVESGLYDAWVTNWEPNLWNRKGCFCDRCKRAFAAFAKLPQAQVLALEGKGILAQHGDQWRLYRRDLNNRLMRLAYAVFEALGRERGKPIPAFLWVGPGAICQARGEMDIGPVIREGSTIAGWAYEGVQLDQGRASTVNHLKVAQRTEEVMAAVAEHNPSPEFKYLHCVLGAFGSYVTTPEEMELDLLSSALARPWLISAWDAPLSYDYRYAQAFARAIRTVAAHEDMILTGAKSDRVPLTPLSITHQGGAAQNLWARSFAKDGKVLYALFNFDRQHEVFFTLKVDPKEGDWVLHDPVQRLAFTSHDSAPWLAERDRTQGARLHLGAARARFLRLEPVGADPERWRGYRRLNCRR